MRSDEPFTIALVGWMHDDTNSAYLAALATLISTIRTDRATDNAVTVQLRLAATRFEMPERMSEPADLLIYGGHSGIGGDSYPYLGTRGDQSIGLEHLSELGISATGIVMDCCRSGHPAFLRELTTCLREDAAALVCNQTAHYPYGPIIVPNLIGSLVAPDVPRHLQPAEMAEHLLAALDLASRVWPRGKFERWTVHQLRSRDAPATVTADI
jgi:hypothetical protein